MHFEKKVNLHGAADGGPQTLSMQKLTSNERDVRKRIL